MTFKFSELRRFAPSLSLVSALIALPSALISVSQLREVSEESKRADDTLREARALTKVNADQANALQELAAAAKLNLKESEKLNQIQHSIAVSGAGDLEIRREEARQNASVKQSRLNIESWNLQDFSPGKIPRWETRVVNAGASTRYSSTAHQSTIRSGPIPAIAPSCADTLRYGSAKEIETSHWTAHRATEPLSEADYTAVMNGEASYVVSGTMCYDDPITKRSRISRYCFKYSRDYANPIKCKSGNSIIDNPQRFIVPPA